MIQTLCESFLNLLARQRRCVKILASVTLWISDVHKFFSDRHFYESFDMIADLSSSILSSSKLHLFLDR